VGLSRCCLFARGSGVGSAGLVSNGVASSNAAVPYASLTGVLLRCTGDLERPSMVRVAAFGACSWALVPVGALPSVLRGVAFGPPFALRRFGVAWLTDNPAPLVIGLWGVSEAAPRSLLLGICWRVLGCSCTRTSPWRTQAH
jgi:hypothetical protein